MWIPNWTITLYIVIILNVNMKFNHKHELSHSTMFYFLVLFVLFMCNGTTFCFVLLWSIKILGLMETFCWYWCELKILNSTNVNYWSTHRLSPYLCCFWDLILVNGFLDPPPQNGATVVLQDKKYWMVNKLSAGNNTRAKLVQSQYLVYEQSHWSRPCSALEIETFV